MPYLNVDDGMDEHPKVDALSDKAYRLLMASMHHCARNLTDGYVSLAKARRLTATASDAVAKELVDAGVWHDLGEGCNNRQCIEERTCPAEGRKSHYVVHDYLQWNHSKRWWDSRRKGDADRKRKARAEREAGRSVREESDRSPQDVRSDVRKDSLHQNRTEQNRTNPPALTSAVDGWGFVTDLQTAREERVKPDGFEGETA